MKKKNIILGLLLGLGLSFSSPTITKADTPCGVGTTGLDGAILLSYPETKSHTITVDLSDAFNKTDTYFLTVERNGTYINSAKSPKFTIDGKFHECKNNNNCVSVDENRVVTWTITQEGAFKYIPDIQGGFILNEAVVDLVWEKNWWTLNKQCDVGTYKIERSEAPGKCDEIKAFQVRGEEDCYLNKNVCTQEGEPVVVEITGLRNTLGDLWTTKVGLKVKQISGGGTETDPVWNTTPINGNATLSFTPNSNSPISKFDVIVEDRVFGNEEFSCHKNFTVKLGCEEDECLSEEEAKDPDIDTEVYPFELCRQIPDSQVEAKGKCEICLGNDGVWTAIGCVDTSSTEGIVGKLMTVGMNIAGGIALLMILAAAFMFSTSEGEPKRTSEAKEILTSAIIGLIFIIFSVTILQFIGVNILHIPGFGE